MRGVGSAHLFRAWGEMRRFNALEPEDRAIVFYAEDAASWEHFEPIVRELTGTMGRRVCYLTSSITDPVLSRRQQGLLAFYIGAGTGRTVMFLRLKAGAMVMTMPDLGTYHIKRSMVHPVHYVYVFHSMVSTHMIYRKGAFDHFDTVLCAGPHHVREIRATEALYGVSPKNLVEHGYGRLDSLLQGHPQGGALPRSGRTRHVLVAPSWGPNGLIETHGLRLTKLLLDAGYHVTVRPHPLTARKWPRVIDAWRERFAGDPNAVLETDVASADSLQEADVMISDFSGAALEYAFAFERPVLFVDLPRKVNNPNYGAIQCDPLEVTIREEIGCVVSPDRLDEIPGCVDRLCADAECIRERIRRARDRAVYNVGNSGTVGAKAIARVVDDGPGAGGESRPHKVFSAVGRPKDRTRRPNTDPSPERKRRVSKPRAGTWDSDACCVSAQGDAEVDPRSIQVEEMLDAVRAQSANLPEPEPDRIHTARILVALAEAWPEPLTEAHLTDLQALCRKLAVARQVRSVYHKGWKKSPEAEPLPTDWWPLLIAVLLAYATHQDRRHMSSDDGTDELGRGQELCNLNAALTALDLTEGLADTAYGAALRVWADRILDGIDDPLDSRPRMFCEVGS